MIQTLRGPHQTKKLITMHYYAIHYLDRMLEQTGFVHHKIIDGLQVCDELNPVVLMFRTSRLERFPNDSFNPHDLSIFSFCEMLRHDIMLHPELYEAFLGAQLQEVWASLWTSLQQSAPQACEQYDEYPPLHVGREIE